jgi:putative transposase
MSDDRTICYMLLERYAACMSHVIRKTHNVSVLLYHFVCPTKYRRSVISAEVDAALVQICTDIADRYEIEFVEIGADRNHVHFLIQSVPTYSPTKIITIVKSLTARELFARMPGLKKSLWGQPLGTSGQGKCLLVQWLLCRYGRTLWRRSGNTTLHQRAGSKGLSTLIRSPTHFV